jgi:hypothetical protein
MKHSLKPLPVFLVWLGILGLIYYTFANTLADPGHSITELGGDSLKNYFTYLYHIHYGSGFWFDGMNYPYGEHLTYTDAQPLLAVPLAYLHKMLGFSPSVSLALMHILIPLSYVLGCFFVYRILKYKGVDAVPALIFAALILTLSPQVVRASGHFGLSYACYLPMIFYWTLLYHETGRLRFVVWFTLLSILMTFLHPYFAAMACIWTGFYVLGLWFVRWRTPRAVIRTALPFVIAAVLIFGVVRLFMAATDPITDRPVYPYDILNSFTVGEQVLTSEGSVVWKWIKDAGIYEAPAKDPEKNYYPGLVALVVVLTGIFSFIRRNLRPLARREESTEAPVVDPVWVVMTAGVVIFTFGVPFVWGFEGLIDLIPPLRQFRSVGRFGWIAYYFVSIYGVVVLYRWFAAKRALRPRLAYGVLIPAICLWAVESFSYADQFRRSTSASSYNYEMFFSTKEQNWEQFIAQQGWKKEDFQGLLLLPFVHIGSEKIWLGANHAWLMTLGAKAAMQLQLPMVDVMLSRNSWAQTWAQVKVSGGPYVEKSLFRTGDDRPFLLMVYEEAPVSHDERYLVEVSEYLGARDQCRVYVLYPEKIRAIDSARRSEARAIAAVVPPGGDTVCAAPGGIVYSDHMDRDGKHTPLFRAGCAPAVTEPSAAIASVETLPSADSMLHEFSVWVAVRREDYRSPYFEIDLLDSAGNLLLRQPVHTSHSVDNQGLWLRASAFFPVPAACRKIICNLHNPGGLTHLALDELMIRPADALIIARDAEGKLMVNNHLLQE